ncbi:MAG TPA: tetratricopeptide repeat protein, partial [Chlamydiales bacterium]|nr:tetratricopeptide repeat protein [Chlamydiales bacterium]
MKKYFFVLFSLSLALSSPLPAPYFFKNGSLVDVQDAATMPLEDHFQLGMDAMKEKKWLDAIQQFRIITLNFASSELGKEAFYYLGVSYYHAGDADLANKKLSAYLEQSSTPHNFTEAFHYKLRIADAFKNGARKHLFNQEKLPRWFAERDQALKIYDEIVAAFPSHDLGAKALFSKAELLHQTENFKAAIEAYQAVIKKFPKRDMAAQSYLQISKLLLDESRIEFQNPDLIPLAEMNLKRFSKDFPKASEQHLQAQANTNEIKELFATGLYETAKLYERKGKLKAAVLYYHQAITEFPQTKIAKECTLRLHTLDSYAQEMELLPNDKQSLTND